METRKTTPASLNMQQRRAAGQTLITEDMALEIARLIVLEEIGEGGLKAQLPLSASSQGEYWRVVGHDNDAFEENEFGRRVPFGTVNMLISKYNGQISDLSYEVRFSQFETP